MEEKVFPETPEIVPSKQKSKKRIIIIVLVVILATAVLGIGGYFSYTKFIVKPSPNSNARAGCKVGGCSSELCVDEDSENVYSICIYSPMYDCYKTATCEKQDNGECGWTETSELQQCLEKFEKG